MKHTTKRHSKRYVVFSIVAITAFFLTIALSNLRLAPASTADVNFAEAISLADAGLLHPSVSAESIADRCTQFSESEIYVQRNHSISISPEDDWISAIENARPNTEILLLDGRYTLHKHAVALRDHTTIRSASQNPDSVVISGRGYTEPGEGFVVAGNDVTIADVSITAMRDHAIHIKPGIGAEHTTRIYNVKLFDIGTQHIKLSTGGSDSGLVACSAIGYTENGASGDYNGGIDLHQASNWVIRDNTLYNIRGDGSGCNVDKDCGRYVSGPAILVWNKSKNTHITRNRIFNSYRNIALGLGRGHTNGTIDDNLIVQTAPGDAGIELQTATDTVVENNTVILSGRYPGAIEFRQSENITIRSNRLTSKPHNRGGNRAVNLHENTVDTDLFNTLTNK